MPSRTAELEIFKTEIDLRLYAASQGYEINRKKSYGTSTVMVNGADIVVIGKNAANGHFIYWQVDAGEGGIANDAGSIIDFVQQRKGGSLGEVRKELRPWVNGSLSYRHQQPSFAPLKPTTKDLMKVQAEYEASTPVTSHAYLEQERGIPAAVLADTRFVDRIRTDWRGNAIFPHINTEGVCGLEKKNTAFTSFSSGGTKGLWCSRTREGDTALVIAETAIDALSHYALKKFENARYISTGGALSPAQHDLIKRAMEKMADGSQIVLALDHDEGGDKLADRLTAIFGEMEGGGRVLEEDRPSSPGDDWNDALRASVSNSGLVSDPSPNP